MGAKKNRQILALLTEFKVLEVQFSTEIKDKNASETGFNGTFEFTSYINDKASEAMLHMKVGLSPIENGYSINITSSANFKFAKEGMSDNEIREYLTNIGQDRLYDQTRSYVRMITSAGEFGSVNLPAINFSTLPSD